MPAFEAPVYTLKGIKIRFGSKQLFEDVELYINRGDKISLVGRNGSGKSTLLKIIAGIIEPDDGEIFIQPNVKIGYMPQDADLSGFKTLREAVAAGLDKHDGSEDYKTDMWIEQLEIAADADPATASGGERRKATLARALIEEPDILLLDEPTNHLDMPTIENWKNHRRLRRRRRRHQPRPAFSHQHFAHHLLARPRNPAPQQQRFRQL